MKTDDVYFQKWGPVRMKCLVEAILDELNELRVLQGLHKLDYNDLHGLVRSKEINKEAGLERVAEKDIVLIK